MSEIEPPFLPRWLRYAIIPGVLAPVFVLVFIFVNELAHNETRCPYTAGETRALSATVAVREDHRRCLFSVEDHRFSVIRAGHEHTLGRRRFSAEAFAPASYRWEAKLSPQDEVSVRVHNAGHADATFREGTPADEKR